MAILIWHKLFEDQTSGSRGGGGQANQAEKGLDMMHLAPRGEDTTELMATVAACGVSRRRFLQLLGGAAGAVATTGTLAACSNEDAGGETEGSSVVGTTTETSLVRLFSVPTPQDGGLYDDILPEFQRQTGYQVELTEQSDVYAPARDGQADVVISHYGHADAQAFVQEGFGQWPQTVFSNQLALLGISDDPAQVRDLDDLVEAFHRIAETQSPYIVNNAPHIEYLSEILWHGADRPEKGEWYSPDLGPEKRPDLEATAQQGGYVIWGLIPFLKNQQRSPVDLQPLVLSDPLLRRIMMSVAVNPDKVTGVNVEGVTAFQQYLLAPATQARIRALRLPGIDQQIWWPAGRDNASSLLAELLTVLRT